VLPAGLTLRREGASKGATVSFLISVPETDIVSILLTYGLLGPVMAVFRPVAAVITAMVTGTLVNLLERFERRSANAGDDQAASDECARRNEYDPQKGALWNAAHYGFVKFFDDIIMSLLIGIILGGAITALLPGLGIERLSGSTWLTMLAMLVVGIPMYVCATSSTPIAAGLIASGISPGAALVFLLAGPATNMASLIVLYKHLGRMTLIVYLACIAVISILMGVWLDVIVTAPSIAQYWDAPLSAETSVGAFKIAGAVLLAVLSYLSLRRLRAFDRALQGLNRVVGLSLRSGQVKAGAVALLVIAYVCSGFFVVMPGQRAAETRFGRIIRPDLEPGLHYSWPYPIGRADVESVARVRRVELGFRRPAVASPIGIVTPQDKTLLGESWMLTGNEDIIAITWVMQYRVADSTDGFLNYVYGVADQEELVRCATESTIRQTVGCRNIDTLLTTDRGDVESEAVRHLGDLLADYRAGIEVVGLHLQDVHAPPDVHPAFRDVASAAEDKAKEVNFAEEYAERVVRQARGDAAGKVRAAEANGTEIVELAAGESGAFLEKLEAYRVSPAITWLRLYFESVDNWLPPLTKYVNLAGDAGAELDLWLIRSKGAAELPIPSTIGTRSRD